MRGRSLRALVIVLIVLGTVGCDQASKGIARAHLADRGTVHLVGSLLVLHYVENTGAFLSIGEALPRPLRLLSFVAFPIIVIAGMILYVARRKETAWAVIAGLAFIVGGGCGNLIDRLLRDGRVGDFLNIGIGPLRTGIFNFADLFVLAGCLLLLLSPKKKPPRAGAESPRS